MKLNTIAIASCLAITSIAFAQNKEMNRDSTDIGRLAPYIWYAKHSKQADSYHSSNSDSS